MKKFGFAIEYQKSSELIDYSCVVFSIDPCIKKSRMGSFQIFPFSGVAHSSKRLVGQISSI